MKIVSNCKEPEITFHATAENLKKDLEEQRKKNGKSENQL